MKRLFALIALLAFASALHAQVVDATVCGILKDPASFNGKMVRVKGTVIAGFDSFIVKDESCQGQVNALWLSYPEGTKGKAGPEALLQLQPAKNFAGTVPAAPTPIKLEKNSDFKQFDQLLSTRHKMDGMCLGCIQYAVSATLVGRLDGVAHAGVHRDKDGKIVGIEGFGNLNAYPARLVLESVSQISTHEADYSKSDAVAKNEESSGFTMQGANAEDMAVAANIRSTSRFATTLDPIRALGDIRQQAASAFPPGSPIVLAIDRAADAYNAHDSVKINYGVPNEVREKDEARSKHDSPDGVIFNCTFNASRLQGEALAAATVHIGEHVADIRSPQPDVSLPTLFDKEYRAWVTTTLQTLATGRRTLSVSGGYILWNDAWPQAARTSNLDSAVTDFLRFQEMLSR